MKLTTVTGFALIVLFIILLIVSPLVVIWSLNTLFPVLAIGYSLDTWLATIVLSSVITGGITGGITARMS